MSDASGMLGLLDSDAGTGEAAAERRDALKRALASDRAAWLEAVQESEALTEPRAWRLLAWVETSAPSIVREQDRQLVSDSAFAFSLLAASPLDRRDVMVVAALVRRAAKIASIDFPARASAGCADAGTLGAETLRWLRQTSSELPATHQESGEGRDYSQRRKPADLDAEDLLRRITSKRKPG